MDNKYIFGIFPFFICWIREPVFALGEPLNKKKEHSLDHQPTPNGSAVEREREREREREIYSDIMYNNSLFTHKGTG